MCGLCCARQARLSMVRAQSGAIAGAGGKRSARMPLVDPRSTHEHLEAGSALLRRVPSVDIHSHPGRFFLRGLTEHTPFTESLPLLSPEDVTAEMQVGGVSAVLFAAVADNPLLDSMDSGLRAVREFRQGEAITEYQRQLGILQTLVREETVSQARNEQDIARAHAHGRTACMFSVEGGDFIEDRLDRVAEAYEQGIRTITLIHYHTNQIGDTQTESAAYGGLTKLGREILKEMDRVGIVVDLAHASFEATRDAAAVSTRPMLISHTNLRTATSDHPRLISVEQARLVTRTGGVVGAVAAGFGQDSFSEYLDTIVRMVDLLGVDHVAIGTDMDFTYEPVFTSYLDWVRIPAGLLARGLNRDEVAKVIGGNFLRILRQVGEN
jgi:membrane dipeptidase